MTSFGVPIGGTSLFAFANDSPCFAYAEASVTQAKAHWLQLKSCTLCEVLRGHTRTPRITYSRCIFWVDQILGHQLCVHRSAFLPCIWFLVCALCVLHFLVFLSLRYVLHAVTLLYH